MLGVLQEESLPRRRFSLRPVTVKSRGSAELLSEPSDRKSPVPAIPGMSSCCQGQFSVGLWRTIIIRNPLAPSRAAPATRCPTDSAT